MSQKKIFRLFSRLNVGGPALHVVNLTAGLRSFGYETTLVVGSPDPSEGSMEYYARENHVDILRLPFFQAKLSLYKDMITLIELVKLFHKEKPDIVHTHTFKAGLLGRIAALIARVPMIVHTYHGHLLSGYTKGYKIRVLVFIERALGTFTDRLIAVSPQVSQDLNKASIAPAKKFSVIDLGFDMQRLLNEIELPSTLKKEFNIPPEAKVVGIVGRLVPVKSVDLFLHALGPLLLEKPDLHLIIIGNGKERAYLENVARSYDWNLQKIHFTGWRHPAAKDFRSLDICVCSSKNEGTSVSIIEALVAGVPVVSTDVGGMRDLLDNGRWGTLVPGEALALRTAIKSVLENPQARSDARSAAHHFVKKFSTERLNKNIDALYREIGDEHAKSNS
jgi:glycosyltransferase involved in cell wall biosynthesis